MERDGTPPAGLAGHVDHVGIAVEDLDAAVTLWRDVLGLELERIETVASEQVRVAMLRLRWGDPVGHVELLEPLSPDSNLGRFLAKRGPGLHHVAVAADDMAAALDRCRAAGLEPLSAEPLTGAGGKQVVFLHPRGTGRVLVELCARPAENAGDRDA